MAMRRSRPEPAGEAPSPADWYEALVEKTPGVQGGAPCLAGTRTPVGTVVVYARMYRGDTRELRAAFPHLTQRHIEAAFAYYEHHQAEVDADEREQDEAWERLLRSG